MMMLNLNFLPEEFRRRLKTIAWVSWIRNVLRSAVVLLVAYDIFLLLIYVVLSEQSAMLAGRTKEMSQSYSFYNQEVDSINKRVAAVNQAGSNFGLLTPRFWMVISTLPDNIQLKNLTMSLEQSGRLSLTGIAKSREALLAYEAILAKIPWVEKTNLPTSQLLQKENINFTIELTTKPPSAEEYLGMVK